MSTTILLQIFVVIITLQHVNGCCKPCKMYTCGKRQYFLQVYSKVNYLDAISLCRDNGMKLATIICKEDNDKIADYIFRGGFGGESFWTSGNDLIRNGQYFWSSTGKQLTYENWIPGEPNNGGATSENCIAVGTTRDGKMGWYDTECAYPLYAICEEICCDA